MRRNETRHDDATKQPTHTVTLPALEHAKVLAWNEMFEQKLRKADLARMLDVHTPQIGRLFDLTHSSKIEFVKQAARASSVQNFSSAGNDIPK
jgi:hypothetical protein